jgi:hypothetical protein
MPSTYTPIATQTLGSNASSISFSSIPSTYTDLVLVGFMRGTDAGFNNMNFARLTFNGVTSSLYSHTSLFQRNTGGGEGAYSERFSNETSMNTGGVASSSFASDIFSSYILNVMNYANTTTNKTVLSRVGTGGNITSMDGNYANAGLWRSTSAINEITLTPSAGNYLAGSMFTLYGIKAA